MKFLFTPPIFNYAAWGKSKEYCKNNVKFEFNKKEKTVVITRILLLCFAFGILLGSCSSEETLLESNRKDAIKLQTVSFSDLAKNQGALRAYRAYNRKLEAERLQARGITFYGVLVDTTKIYYTEKGDLKSYTFEIVDFSSRDTIKNLVLQSKSDQSYMPYVAKYALSEADKSALITDGNLMLLPTRIENEQQALAIPISGDGADCLNIYTITQNYCYKRDGSIQLDNGDVDNGCYRPAYVVEQTIFSIDMDCLTGGGSSFVGPTIGGPTTGGPTTGGPVGPGGSSSFPTNGISPINPDLISLPIFNINRTEMRILANLNPLQTQWWNTANPEIKTQLREILSVWNQENLEFVKWTIDYLIENPEVTWEQLYNLFFKPYPDISDEQIDDINEDQIIFEEPVLQESLPTLDSFKAAFPKNGVEGNYTQMETSAVYQLVGGTILNSHLNNPSQYSNGCTIRGSRGLLYSNPSISIPILIYNGSQRTQKGADLKNYILDAVSFNKFMKVKFGDTTNKLEGAAANNQQQVLDMLEGKTGIYVIINNSPGTAGYSGHVDLIINGQCIGGEYIRPAGGVKSIRVWTLN